RCLARAARKRIGRVSRAQRRVLADPASAAIPDQRETTFWSPFFGHHLPLFGIEAHGSFGGSGSPFCNSSIECLSGERTNAILPSRGGRLIVTPPFINRSQTA